jgi:hypothetical protein
VPKFLLPLTDTYESTTRPVISEITKQLFEVTGLPSNTVIFFPGEIEKAIQPGSTMGSEAVINNMPFHNRLAVSVEENYEVERLNNTAVMRPENLFIFRDQALETSIKPVYSCTATVINFTYRAVDKVSAQRWRDDIRARVSMERDIRYHDVSYHYILPPELLVILKEIHRMREAVAGYGESFETYLFNHITKRASDLTTLAGTQSAIGISETQCRIVGYFDFEGVPELGNKDDDGDTWTITFSYKFQYDKPLACVMFYPLMVHNQLMGDRFRDLVPLKDYEKINMNRSLSLDCFSVFEKSYHISNVDQGYAIPAFDEFVPASIPSNTLRVFTALTNIDPIMPNFLLSLKELGSLGFDPILLAFLAIEAPFMTRLNKSIFSIDLYIGSDLVYPNPLEVAPDLSVYTKIPLSLRSYYHVRLSINADVDLLSKEAWERMRINGLATKKIYKVISPNGVCPPFIRGKGLGDGTTNTVNQFTKDDFNKIVDDINKNTIAKGNGQSYRMNTVETLFIQTQPR